MRLVIPGSGHPFLSESGRVAELLEVPRSLAVAPGANLRSGNEAVVVAHDKCRLLRRPHRGERVVHRLTDLLAEITQPPSRVAAVHDAADEA